jgi:transposase
VVVIDGQGYQVGVRRVMHTPEGLTALTEFLAAITGPERKAELACIIETTHGLLIAALLEAGYPVYPVNPKTVDRKRGAAGAKTDQIDAYLLAKHGRAEFADLRRREPDSPLVAELKVLTRDQDSLIQMQTRQVESTDRLPQSLVSRRPDLVHQAAAALDPDLPASLSHSA